MTSLILALVLALLIYPQALSDLPSLPEPIPIVEAIATNGAFEAKPKPIRTEVFEITAYEYTGCRTATGTWPEIGSVASDWSVLPPGTRIYVPAIDYYGVVEDTGGAIHGQRLDLYMGSVEICNQFGRQWLEVEILEVPSE